MYKRILFILCIVVLMISCKAWISKQHGFNQEFKFKTKSEYLNYLQTVKRFDTTHVLFVDRGSIDGFLFNINRDELSVYYGTLVNDSTEIKKTETLQDNLSCMGRILGDVNRNVARLADTSLYVRNDFHKFKFRQVGSGTEFNYYHSNKPLRIILLYSYALGRYFDPFFNEMNNFSLKNPESAELYIISLDYSYHFN